MTSELGELSTTSETKPWETPSAQKIARDDFPNELLLIKSNMLYIPLEDLSAKAINHLKRIASFKNPEFYAKLGMRLSTYNVPRIISCAEPSDKYIALPRGCEDAITNLLDENHVSYRMNDQTELGTPTDCSYKKSDTTQQWRIIWNYSIWKNRSGYRIDSGAQSKHTYSCTYQSPARPMENPIGRILGDRLQARGYATQTWTQKSIFSFWNIGFQRKQFT